MAHNVQLTSAHLRAIFSIDHRLGNSLKSLFAIQITRKLAHLLQATVEVLLSSTTCLAHFIHLHV